MSRDEFVAPIAHSTGSAVATTASEVGKRGLGGMAKGALFLPAAGAVIGGFMGVGGLISAIGASFGAASIGAGIGMVGAAVAGLIAPIAIGALIGAGLMFVPFVGGALVGIGGVLGAVKGAKRGGDRVHNERQAAAVVDAQIQMARAQNGSGFNTVTPQEAAMLEARMRNSNNQGSHLANLQERAAAAAPDLPAGRV